MHDDYLAKRRRIESDKLQARSNYESASPSNLVNFPRDNDVLIGRGRPYHEYCGTRRLISIIDTQLDRYYMKNDPEDTNNEDSRFWKTCINIEMVKKTKEADGRFLQRTPKGWKILSDTQAREKSANLFRYRYNLLQNPRISKKGMLPLTSSGGPSVANSTNAGSCTQKRLRDEENFTIPPNMFDGHNTTIMSGISKSNKRQANNSNNTNNPSPLGEFWSMIGNHNTSPSPPFQVMSSQSSDSFT